MLPIIRFVSDSSPYFADSNKKLKDVMTEFNGGGRLSRYNADGVSRESYPLPFLHRNCLFD
jgi:hypothetical protein